MPLYEYKCGRCKTKFDKRKPLQNREFAICPKCGNLAGKIMSVVNHSFGFRLTDDSHLVGNPDQFEMDI